MVAELPGFRRDLKIERRITFWESRDVGDRIIDPNRLSALTVPEATAVAARRILIGRGKSARLLLEYAKEADAARVGSLWPDDREALETEVVESEKRTLLIEGSRAYKSANRKSGTMGIGGQYGKK